MKKNRISRRQFIQQSSMAMAAVSASGLAFNACSTAPKTKMTASGIPLRTLGKTGEEITILGYGGGSQFMLMPDGEWEPHLEYALNAGINYFDTSSSYGAETDKPSEMRYGEILPAHRKKIILLTKLHEREPDKTKAEFEESLRRLKTDYVDILLIHSVGPDDTLQDIESGVYKVFREFKEQKMTRYIGFSSMDSAERSKELLENLEFDVTLLAINPTKYQNFGEIALPVAREKNLGVIAMKIMRDIVNQYAKPKELLEYVWNKDGVHCALVSQTGLDPLKENLSLVMEYGKQPTPTAQSLELEHRLAHLAASGQLIYSRPGYKDGMIC